MSNDRDSVDEAKPEIMNSIEMYPDAQARQPDQHRH